MPPTRTSGTGRWNDEGLVRREVWASYGLPVIFLILAGTLVSLFFPDLLHLVLGSLGALKG
ncbi:MAG TPA: hypothetical protein ENF57_01875 [Candidatus Korarchaeota archaeon]|nr:hypothetical protein [Candidatus Korarchaeota archaeon]